VAGVLYVMLKKLPLLDRTEKIMLGVTVIVVGFFLSLSQPNLGSIEDCEQRTGLEGLSHFTTGKKWAGINLPLLPKKPDYRFSIDPLKVDTLKFFLIGHKYSELAPGSLHISNGFKSKTLGSDLLMSHRSRCYLFVHPDKQTLDVVILPR
jgi:hypothetical protein